MTLPTIEQVIDSPSASLWLKAALRGAVVRDVVDASADAELLARLLERRLDQTLKSLRDGVGS